MIGFFGFEDLEEDGSVEITSMCGFKPQKEIICNKLLPYADQLDSESNEIFLDIKINLSRAVLLREIDPGCSIWTSRLNDYIKLYGLKFSKEDHVALVNLFYDILIIPDLDVISACKFADLLITLLRKKYLLSPNDIVLQWRPLYDLCRKLLRKKNHLGVYISNSTLRDLFRSLILLARTYFPETATQEILDELKPKLCPVNCSQVALRYLEWFLPVSLPPEKAHLGYKLWLTDIMDLWATCNNAPVWESSIMRLLANLAKENVGYIDWEPYIPMMFTRFLRVFDFPVVYKQHRSPVRSKIDMDSVTLWIVSVMDKNNSCQYYLDKFLKTIESYYHPANYGVWFSKLKSFLYKLPDHFVQRVNFERFKNLRWQTPVPNSHKLTEEDIDKFVESMKGVAFRALFSKMGSMALKHLAILRPKIIIPPLLERVYSTIDSVTEPHKFTSLMSCMSEVVRHIVDGPSFGYPEGRTHIIPLLMSTLPGIDANDIKKSSVTIQFILVCVILIPIIDSSKAGEYWSDLTEEEEAVCAATANFEDFVAQFFDRIFVFIENSSVESTRNEKCSLRSSAQTLIKRAISPVCAIVLSQCSTDIFKMALKKSMAFATKGVMETQLAGRLIGLLFSAFSFVNSEETLKCLLPHLCGRILSLTESEEVRKEETLDDELHYYLVLLETIEYRGSVALTYLPDILSVLDRILSLSSREGIQIGSMALQGLLKSLTTIVPLENRSVSRSYDIHVKDYLPIRDWGKAYSLEEVNIEWYVPGEKEIKAIETIVLKYLPPELKKLENHITDEAPLTREELLKSFDIILGTLSALEVMPLWDEKPLTLIETAVKLIPTNIITGIKGAIKMPDGENIRSVIFEIFNKLQKKLLACEEDDTRSLLRIILVWESLLLNVNSSEKKQFAGLWDGFVLKKRILRNPLIGKKYHLRKLLIDRAAAQIEIRAEMAVTSMTETHKLIMLNLFELSCSRYSEVRKNAQSALSKALSRFPHSYRILLPKILENLQLDPVENHERYKGTLYMLFLQKEISLPSFQDWDVLLKIWPALIRTKLSEKFSIFKLFDSIEDEFFQNFAPLSFIYEIPESCLEKAQILVSSCASVTAFERENGLKLFKEKYKKNNEFYFELLNSLMDASEQQNLHWRFYSLALHLMKCLAQTDVPYPPRVVKAFLHTLINGSLELRKMAIKTIVLILRQQRRKKKTVIVDVEKIAGCRVPKNPSPGVRPDNMWLQYTSSKVPKTPEDWDAVRYCHKCVLGYYQWPKKLTLSAPSYEEPSLDRADGELKPEEKEVRDFFSNPDHVGQLINYLSLEDIKGEDEFSMTRFLMFKRLFKNHGDSFFHVFKPHLQKLVVDKQESSQICAAEIIAGVIRGSKHWCYEKTLALWEFLGPLIRTALSNMTEETDSDWGLCFATAAMNKDPNKNHWMFEVLMENPLGEKFSLLGCARLTILQDALIQQIWRVSELLQRLLEYIVPFLGHPFQNVRETIATVLTEIFEPDIKLPGGNTLGPHPNEFLAAVVPKLSPLYSLVPGNGFPEFSVSKDYHLTKLSTMLDSINLYKNDNGDDVTESLNEKAVIRLFKTTCMWIIFTFSRSSRCIIPEFYSIFPLLCSLEGHDQDEELTMLCSKALSALAQGAIAPEHIPVVFESVQKVAKYGSWLARSSVVGFLEVFIFRNMSLILSSPEWTTTTTNIVLMLLEDERIEVREKAAKVLGGLFHCGILSNSEELLKNFKEMVKSEIKNQKSATENADILRKKHSGILGLCAFINSSPYDVPDCVPEIFYVLGSHWNDPEPIPSTIRKTLNDFRRTHHDNWERHKLKFTQRQLDVLNDLNVPSYCA